MKMKARQHFELFLTNYIRNYCPDIDDAEIALARVCYLQGWVDCSCEIVNAVMDEAKEIDSNGP